MTYKHARRFGSITAILISGILGSHIVSAQTIELYKNDFNTPNLGASNCEEGVGGPAWLEHGTFNDDYNTRTFRFDIAGSVDRMCFTPTKSNTNDAIYVDTKDPQNLYSGAFATAKTQGPNGAGGTEGVGMLLNPQGQSFLNFSMDWSRMNIQGGAWPPDGDVEITVGYYKVPAGQRFWVASNGRYGPPTVGIGSEYVTANLEKKFTVPRTNRDPAQGLYAEWLLRQDSIDLRALGFGPTDQVGIAFYPLIPNATMPAYVAFDNLLITASPTAAYIPPPPPLIISAPDNTTDTTPIITGSGPALTPMTLTLIDSANITQNFTLTTDANGAFSLDIGMQSMVIPLAIGSYTATINYVNAAGNTVTQSDAGSVVASAPISLTIIAPDNTTDTTPVISGNGPVNTPMTLTLVDKVGVIQKFAISTDDNGAFSFDLGAQPSASPLAIGEFTATISYINASGQTISQSDQGSVLGTGAGGDNPTPVPVNSPLALFILTLIMSMSFAWKKFRHPK